MYCRDSIGICVLLIALAGGRGRRDRVQIRGAINANYAPRQCEPHRGISMQARLAGTLANTLEPQNESSTLFGEHFTDN